MRSDKITVNGYRRGSAHGRLHIANEDNYEKSLSETRSPDQDLNRRHPEYDLDVHVG